MPIYRILNKDTKEWWEGEAFNPYEALELAGWTEGRVWIREKTQRGAGGWKTPSNPQSTRKVESEK